jgi:hypothetical protein
MDNYRFDRDPWGPLTSVHGGHPVWMRLELATRAQDNFRMARDPAGTLQAVPSNPGLKNVGEGKFG